MTADDAAREAAERLWSEGAKHSAAWPLEQAAFVAGAAWQSEQHPNDTKEQKKVTRLTVNLAPTVADALKATADRHGLSITEAIRHAIAVWKLVSDARARGNRVVITDRDGGNVREVVLV